MRPVPLGEGWHFSSPKIRKIAILCEPPLTTLARWWLSGALEGAVSSAGEVMQTDGLP